MTMTENEMAVPFARNEREVEDLLEKAIDLLSAPVEAAKSTDFQRGVHQTLNWLLGVQTEPPL